MGRDILVGRKVGIFGWFGDGWKVMNRLGLVSRYEERKSSNDFPLFPLFIRTQIPFFALSRVTDVRGRRDLDDWEWKQYLSGGIMEVLWTVNGMVG